MSREDYLHIHTEAVFIRGRGNKSIVPYGGNDTDYSCIFRYVASEMSYSDLSSIVIITDGKAEYLAELVAAGIPVLWLLTKRPENQIPPFGKVAIIKR